MASVHDNVVYAKAVDYELCRLVLHTVHPHPDAPEFTDVLFEGVVAHHLEHQAFRGHGVSADILFDVAESELAVTLGHYADLLDGAMQYAWPALKYDGLDDLAARLAAAGSGASRCAAAAACTGSCSRRAWLSARGRRGPGSRA